jgi:hypothetical protein
MDLPCSSNSITSIASIEMLFPVTGIPGMNPPLSVPENLPPNRHLVPGGDGLDDLGLHVRHGREHLLKQSERGCFVAGRAGAWRVVNALIGDPILGISDVVVVEHLVDERFGKLAVLLDRGHVTSLPELASLPAASSSSGSPSCAEVSITLPSSSV